MAAQPPSPQADSSFTNKTAVVEINENTVNNAVIPDINKVLVDRINPDFGILDKLLALRALSRAEIAEVGKLGTFHEKNTQLLELLTKNQKLTELFNALKDTHQEHLVNYVTAKGEYNEAYGGAWPLKEREINILNDNQESLVDLLDFTDGEIIDELYKINFLNRRQKEFICKHPYDYKKAALLLDVLYRSSMNDYWKMITCLRVTKQDRVAKVLVEGGALVVIHNTGETGQATEAENKILRRIEDMVENMNIEFSNRLLERLQLKLFAPRVSKNVKLHIFCGTMKEQIHLSNVLNSGDLLRDIEKIFNRLIFHHERVNVFTSVSETDMENCKKFFERSSF